MLRDSTCRNCEKITSGDCGKHGPKYYPISYAVPGTVGLPEKQVNPTTAAEWAVSCYNHKHRVQHYICDGCVDAYARQQVEAANQGTPPCRWCGWTTGPHDALRCRTDERNRLEEYFREAVDALSPYLQSGGKYGHLMQPGQSITKEGPKRLVEYLEQQVEAERDRLLDEFSAALKERGVSPQRQVYPFGDALDALIHQQVEAFRERLLDYLRTQEPIWPERERAIRALTIEAATPRANAHGAAPATLPAPAIPDGLP